MPRSRRVHFRVSFILPEDATVDDAKDYVREAVASWHGSLQPPGMGPGGEDPDEAGDPMFDLDADTVKVMNEPLPRPKR